MSNFDSIQGSVSRLAKIREHENGNVPYSLYLDDFRNLRPGEKNTQFDIEACSSTPEECKKFRRGNGTCAAVGPNRIRPLKCLRLGTEDELSNSSVEHR